MRRIALVLEYDGTRYAGFQLQANQPSIQGAVEVAIERLTGQPSRVYGAGRTDAGVHAQGQVACFDTDSQLPIERIAGGLNHHLDSDIAVRAAYEVALTFDPRRHAVARTYRYTMLESESRSPLRSAFTYHVARRLDVAAMNEAIAILVGERDFAPFCGNLPTGKGGTMRRMLRTQAWRQEGDEVCLELEANAFLHQQVRRIAGAALDVGLGRIMVAEFAEMADSGVHGVAAHVLPARGLCLRRVEYKEFPPLAQVATVETEVTVR